MDLGAILVLGSSMIVSSRGSPLLDRKLPSKYLGMNEMHHRPYDRNLQGDL